MEEIGFDPKRLADLAHRHGLRLVVLFGSRATGHVHAQSDVDLAVSADRPLEPARLANLISELEALVPGVPVDVADLRRADPLFLRKIFETGTCLFGEPGAFDAERLRALHRYEDYRPFMKLERESVQRALKALR
jgi:predicted nucleotidyltransferase